MQLLFSIEHNMFSDLGFVKVKLKSLSDARSKTFALLDNFNHTTKNQQLNETPKLRG